MRSRTKTRCILASVGNTILCSGLSCYIAAVDPEGHGVVDESTVIFGQMDESEEFRRIHVVPFSDTLPSAYDVNMFTDYIKPFFESHALEYFCQGQTFYYNSVHFKVVATEPIGSCRVGPSTEVFTEGSLHPNITDLLTPEQQMRISHLPPGIQVMLLQANVFGDSDIADRIMNAEQRHRRARNAGTAAAIVNQVTEEGIWSEQLQQNLQLYSSNDCMVCLSTFANGDRVRMLPCNHVFHTQCVDEWLSRDLHCPLCRHDLRRRGGPQ